jgi:hypothetical protein
MPKGIHLSKERKQLIFSHFNAGKTPEECHENIFHGSGSVRTLKHIKVLFRLFCNPSKVDDKIDYLAVSLLMNSGMMVSWSLYTRSIRLQREQLLDNFSET